MHNWDNIRFFLAVARTGSVSTAAEKLAVNQSTVSRRINSFEAEMNVRLFERLTTGYRLTAEGEDMLRRAMRIEDEAMAIEHEVMGKNIELSGPLRVTASLAVVSYVLMPILKEFYAAHPGIELRLDLSDNLYNLTQREADVALRVTTELVPDNLIGRELGKIALAVYGEKRYLNRYLRSSKRQPLRWIGEDTNDPRPTWLHRHTDPLELVMRTNDVLATAAAIRHGLGVGRLPTFVGDALPELKRFDDTPGLPRRALWLLTHPDLRRVNRVRVFNTFLAEKLPDQLS
ncbi:MAG: LysR family transcriptional regulator [Candidatus Thiodiazotropha sp.]